MPNSSKDAKLALEKLSNQVREYYKDKDSPFILAIANGGISLASYLAEQMKIHPVGILNPLFHRDDLGFNPIPKNFQPTQVPFTIEGSEVLIIDDVFASGRTLRATLNELFDHGRPNVVRFATLFSTNCRKLPYSPDFVGGELNLEDDTVLKVHLEKKENLTCNYEILKK